MRYRAAHTLDGTREVKSFVVKNINWFALFNELSNRSKRLDEMNGTHHNLRRISWHYTAVIAIQPVTL